MKQKPKKKLSLKKVTLQTLTNEQMTNIQGGQADGGGVTTLTTTNQYPTGLDTNA